MRANVVILSFVVVAGAACGGGGGGNDLAHCYDQPALLDSWGVCSCSDVDESGSLSPGEWAESDSCGASVLPSGATCCADEDLNGAATLCACERPHCETDMNGSCRCVQAKFAPVTQSL